MQRCTGKLNRDLMLPDDDLNVDPKVPFETQYLDNPSTQPPGAMRKLGDFHIDNCIVSRVQIVPVTDDDFLWDFRVIWDDVVFKFSTLELPDNRSVPSLKYLENPALGPAAILYFFDTDQDGIPLHRIAD